MKIITQMEVEDAVAAYEAHVVKRKAYVASVKKEMAALDAERDECVQRLNQANNGKPFVIPVGDGEFKIVEFKEKQGKLDAEAMAETLRSIRRKPQRFSSEWVPIVRKLSEDEVELLPE